MRLASKVAVRVGALAVAVAAIAVPATAAHAVAPSITADPATGLHDGDTVSVTGSNFAGTGQPFSLVECSSLGGQSDCDLSNIGGGTVGGDGSIPATDFTVHTGTYGDGTCPPTGDGQCYLIASTDAGGADTAVFPISFAPVPAVTVKPDTNVKDGGTVKVSGTGFPANQPTVYVVECSGPSQAQCDLGTLKTGSTNASGAFKNVKLTVHTGTVGTGSCKAGKACLVAASTSTTPDATDQGAAPFTFAKAAKAAATKTKASFSKKNDKISGDVSAAGKGVKGLKTELDIKAGKKWKKVDGLTTGKGGAFSSAKLKKSGKYEVSTPKQGKYGASHSKVIKVKV
jgi:Neocarzinostatin family